MSVNADPIAHEAVIDGLFVVSYGPEDGPAVLMSAGLGGGGSYWKPQLATLARDHRVILYDHRGTGRSDRAALPSPYRVAHLAGDMLVILDGLAIATAHVVGHAAGGIAALQLALDAPARVSTLTVVNGWVAADPHFVRCFDIRREIFRAFGADGYLKVQPLFLYPAGWISEHLAELDADREAHGPSFQARETLFARMAALQAFDIRSELGGIDIPTLIVVSNDDMLVPSAASTGIAEGLPRATLERFAWGGHAVNVTAPDAFNATLLNFLTHHRG